MPSTNLFLSTQTLSLSLSSSMATTFTSIFFLILIFLSQSPIQTTCHPIKTVIVLVMENRSFDHMLGWMKRLNQEINGVDGSESNPVSTSDPNSKRIFFQNQSHYVDPDPGHSFQAIRQQIFGSDDDVSADPPPMNGFAQQALAMDNTTATAQAVMNGFDPDFLPVYRALVSPPQWRLPLPQSFS